MKKKKDTVSKRRATLVHLNSHIRRSEFKVMEDSRDLSFLNAIASDGTRKAYLKAVEATDTIVELENGQIVRRQKNGTIEVIANLDPRKEVQKGKTVILR